MSRTRILPSLVSSQPKSTGPRNIHEWNALLSKAIQRAEGLGDRRLEGLRKAMMDGRSEKILRQMSILSDVDIDREFPPRA